MSQLRDKHTKSYGSSMKHFCGKLFENTGNAIFLRLFFSKTRTEINGTVTLKQYITLHGSKMYPQTKYGIPILHEIQKC